MIPIQYQLAVVKRREMILRIYGDSKLAWGFPEDKIIWNEADLASGRKK